MSEKSDTLIYLDELPANGYDDLKNSSNRNNVNHD